MLQVENLTKRYGKFLAIDKLNFAVNKNEIVGFLGPNGAGKTTTMNIITGYIGATSGKLIFDGEKSKKKIIGYLPDNPPLYYDMTVVEYLDFVSELKCGKKNRGEINNIMNRLKINNVSNRLIRNLSKGYRQRVGLAQALIGNPEILILDEPTSGLDPKQIIEIRDLIRSLKDNHTILISSHILSEISAIADRVVIINKGKIVADNTPEELSEGLMHNKKVNVRLKANSDDILKALRKFTFIKCLEVKKDVEEGTTDLVLESMEQIDLREKVFEFAKQNNFVLLMLQPFNMSLEEVFLQVTDENSSADKNSVAESVDKSEKNGEDNEVAEEDSEYTSGDNVTSGANLSDNKDDNDQISDVEKGEE